MNEWMIKVWGGAWNDNVNPSIETDYGIKEGYYYFTNEEYKDKFLSIIDGYENVARDCKSGKLTHKKTIFIGLYEYNHRRFIIHKDFGYEFPKEVAEYMFLEGDYTLDYNIAQYIIEEYGDDAIPDPEIYFNGYDEFKLIAYKVEHWHSCADKYNGDRLIWVLNLKERNIFE